MNYEIFKFIIKLWFNFNFVTLIILIIIIKKLSFNNICFIFINYKNMINFCLIKFMELDILNINLLNIKESALTAIKIKE